MLRVMEQVPFDKIILFTSSPNFTKHAYALRLTIPVYLIDWNAESEQKVSNVRGGYGF